jgi:hypothetical protein
MRSVKSNRWYMLGVGLALILAGNQSAMSMENATRLSQSTEGQKSAQTQASAEQLEQMPVDELPALVRDGGRMESVARAAAHPTSRVFSIFDAQTVISRDDDDDGFYHHLRVSFDADVADGDTAWVYARLYLSLEGGPWNHYFTTDVFPIKGDANDDDYEVVTNLLDGYPTGYYDVLIELYDADYDVWTANYGPYEDRDLAVLPLEDSYRDDDYHNGGGGAMGPGLCLLALLVVTKGVRSRRGSGAIRA